MDEIHEGFQETEINWIKKCTSVYQHTKSSMEKSEIGGDRSRLKPSDRPSLAKRVFMEKQRKRYARKNLKKTGKLPGWQNYKKQNQQFHRLHLCDWFCLRHCFLCFFVTYFMAAPIKLIRRSYFSCYKGNFSWSLDSATKNRDELTSWTSKRRLHVAANKTTCLVSSNRRFHADAEKLKLCVKTMSQAPEKKIPRVRFDNQLNCKKLLENV